MKIFGNQIFYFLDNCLSHRSKIALNSLNRSSIQAIFLPAYSPQFAPIELIFGITKEEFLIIQTEIILSSEMKTHIIYYGGF